jgi:uncharacterized protein (UPF0335 family)
MSDQLRALTDRVEAAKESRNKAEARKEELDRRHREIISRVKAKGFDPDRLTQELASRELKLKSLLAEAEAILNGQPATPAESSLDHSAVSMPEPVLTETNAPSTKDDVPW